MLRQTKNTASTTDQALPETSLLERSGESKNFFSALTGLLNEATKTLRSYRGSKFRKQEPSKPLSPEEQSQQAEIAKLDNERRCLEIKARITKLKIEIADGEAKLVALRPGDSSPNKEQSKHGGKQSSPRGQQMKQAAVQNNQTKKAAGSAFNGIKGLDKIQVASATTSTPPDSIPSEPPQLTEEK